MSKSWTNLLIIGLLIIAALTGWGMVDAVRQATRPSTAITGGLATQVQQLIHPTPTIYPNPVTVVLQVRSLARLETTQYTIEKVVTAETGQGALAGLFGDRLLFVAHGEVIAGVDLSQLAERDVLVSPDGRVTLVMPAAEVFVATLDNEKSYIYDRQTGVFTHGDINLETLARQVAEQEIEKGALEGGILKTARTNAEAFLERLLLSLGFTSVQIIRATPSPVTP